MTEYPWYQLVNGSDVLQGDLIYACPVVIPLGEISYERAPAEYDISEYDVITLSQSCDIAERKLDLVLVCPFFPLESLSLKSDLFRSSNGKEAVRRGNVAGYHMLNKSHIKGLETDFLVVDFRNVYGVPLDFFIDLATKKGNRLRLLPPYREHLSQAFARFFMRVGLPVDIPSFAKSKPQELVRRVAFTGPPKTKPNAEHR